MRSYVMPFRLWFYLTRAGIPLLVGVALGTLIAGRAGRIIEYVSMSLLIALGLGGALLATVGLVRGRLRMRCPFCGQSGDAWGSKAEGMRMQCPQCGLIYTGGPLWLCVFRERNSQR